jgi:hypothetical protein
MTLRSTLATTFWYEIIGVILKNTKVYGESGRRGISSFIGKQMVIIKSQIFWNSPMMMMMMWKRASRGQKQDLPEFLALNWR